MDRIPAAKPEKIAFKLPEFNFSTYGIMIKDSIKMSLHGITG